MKEIKPADTIIRDVCKVKKNERVLIIANPETNLIAEAIYEASRAVDAQTVLLYQSAKAAFDEASAETIAAIATNPDVCISVSSSKLGKDANGIAHPYKTESGEEFDHVFDYLLHGKKTMRAIWMPGMTSDMYERAVQIDYKELAKRARDLEKAFENATSVHVTASGGTDIVIPIANRKAMSDNGDFSKAGTGGNVPAGEVFISPQLGNGSDFGANGKIVYDGSMTFGDGDALLEKPITIFVEHGFITKIEGDAEANRLKKTISEAEAKALALEKDGKLPKGMGEIYKKNARNIGELGIGLNPAALITGNMLEDEKAFRTCHFAIGENYDNDAPSLIHLDGVVKNPTIVLHYENASDKTILQAGELAV